MTQTPLQRQCTHHYLTLCVNVHYLFIMVFSEFQIILFTVGMLNFQSSTEVRWTLLWNTDSQINYYVMLCVSTFVYFHLLFKTSCDFIRCQIINFTRTPSARCFSMLYVSWKKRTWSLKIRTFCPVLSNQKVFSLTACVIWIFFFSMLPDNSVSDFFSSFKKKVNS